MKDKINVRLTALDKATVLGLRTADIISRRVLSTETSQNVMAGLTIALTNRVIHDASAPSVFAAVATEF